MFILKDKINKKVCKDLINIYENSDQKEMNHNTQHAIMNQVVLYSNNEKLAPFIKELIKVKDKYVKKYKYTHINQEPWNIWPHIKIQKYDPGQSYFGWHAEANGEYNDVLNTKDRILVFSTFLNTIKQGGETEFLYQKEKIKPVEGRTIIFPAYWTHTHRGNLTKETKYIITGWWAYER